MFKKLAVLLAPFVFTPLSLVLTNSAAHAQTSYYRWTSWDNCRFNLRDYTPVSVRLEVRYSDYAARITQVRYGNGNSERIDDVKIWEGRVIEGKPEQTFSVPHFYDTGNQTAWISPIFYRTWISNLGKRYAYVQVYNADGRDCISKIPF